MVLHGRITKFYLSSDLCLVLTIRSLYYYILFYNNIKDWVKKIQNVSAVTHETR